MNIHFEIENIFATNLKQYIVYLNTNINKHKVSYIMVSQTLFLCGFISDQPRLKIAILLETHVNFFSVKMGKF